MRIIFVPRCLTGSSKCLLEDIAVFSDQFYWRVNELEDILTENRIWKERLLDIVLFHVRIVMIEVFQVYYYEDPVVFEI